MLLFYIFGGTLLLSDINKNERKKKKLISVDKKIFFQFYQIFKILFSLIRINYVMIYSIIIIFYILNNNSKDHNIHLHFKNEIKEYKN